MHRRALGMSMAWLVTALAGGRALADAAPPPDYQDECVAAGVKQDAPGCTRCVVPEFKDRGCYQDAAKAGLKPLCHGWSYVMMCPADRTAQAEPAPTIAEPAPTVVAEPAPAPATAPATSTPTAAAAPTPKSKGCAGGDTSWLACVALAALATCRTRAARR